MAVKAIFVLKFEQFQTWNLVSTELGRGTLENVWLRIWILNGGVTFFGNFSATERRI